MLPLCYCVTILPPCYHCYHVNMLPLCYHFVVIITIILPFCSHCYHYVTLLPCYYVTMLPCYHYVNILLSLLLCFHVTIVTKAYSVVTIFACIFSQPFFITYHIKNQIYLFSMTRPPSN